MKKLTKSLFNSILIFSIAFFINVILRNDIIAVVFMGAIIGVINCMILIELDKKVAKESNKEGENKK